MQAEAITVTHPAILTFYQENPHLDVTAMNLILIEILKTLSTNLSSTIQNTVNSQILSVVCNIDKNMGTIKNDLLSQFNERLGQTKRKYMENVKMQLTNGFLSTHEKVSLVLDKTSEAILAKTSSIIHEVIPRSNDQNYKQIEQCIHACCTNIQHDTKRILETTEKRNDETTLLESLEQHFSKLVASIQTPLFHLIQASEERTTGGIQRVQNDFLQQQVNQERLSSELREFLNKYKNNSSTKGAVSEQELYYMLQSAMPCDEIIDVSSLSETCDFRVNRMDVRKPTILFENKDYQRQVRTDEVTKFERDLQTQQVHGIFLSQKTPITFKDNFQIDIINGIIHIYIPNAHYDIEKLKIAIDIIDNLSPKISQIHTKMDRDIYSTTKQDMEELIQEYHNFAIQKSSILETVKTMSKQLLDKLEAMQLPKIKEILLRFGGLDNNSNFKCPHCSFVGKNKASLSAHHNRTNGKCKNTPEENIELENTIIETSVVKNKSSSRKK